MTIDKPGRSHTRNAPSSSMRWLLGRVRRYVPSDCIVALGHRAERPSRNSTTGYRPIALVVESEVSTLVAFDLFGPPTIAAPAFVRHVEAVADSD